MPATADQIRELIAASKPRLLKIPPNIAGKKINPESWSKQEILGHLIDSAANNHQRFVRGAQNVAADFPAYHSDRWVEVQGYTTVIYANSL
jgi:hypothetical protein